VVADNIRKQLHSDLQSISVSIVIPTISQKKKRKERKGKETL
jgi:cation transport regulator ChaB